MEALRNHFIGASTAPSLHPLVFQCVTSAELLQRYINRGTKGEDRGSLCLTESACSHPAALGKLHLPDSRETTLTRESRVDKCAAQILEGKGLNDSMAGGLGFSSHIGPHKRASLQMSERNEILSVISPDCREQLRPTLYGQFSRRILPAFALSLYGRDRENGGWR